VEKSAQAGGDHSTLGFVFREDESDAPTADIPVVRQPSAPPPGQDARRRAVVTVLAAAVALLAIAIAGYLWYVAHSWQDKASALRSEATAAGNEVAVIRGDRDAARTELDQRTVELAEARAQLDEVNQRISELADEKAQATDQQEVARQLAQQAAEIADGLQKCTDGQDQLIQYLTSGQGGVDNNRVIMYAQDVQAACAAARSAHEQLEGLVSRLGD
jgi:septal ring factor EnvC (AmiA/AmiB activator)